MIARYLRWLHTRWPAGTVEPLPEVGVDGTTNLPGVRIVGDLTGIPLLKFALESGARAARAVASEFGAPDRRAPRAADGVIDVAIVGAGVSGMAAAVELARLGLSCEVLEANEPFSTLANFPTRKPIYTYPSGFVPESTLQVAADVKEELVAELRAQAASAGIVPRPARVDRLVPRGDQWRVVLEDGSEVLARRVIVAIGKSGEFRRLGVPGESLDKVFNRLHDPRDFAGRRVLVVGGGDAAVETAVALAEAGATVTLVHRAAELARCKPTLLERLERWTSRAASTGAIELRHGTRVTEILPDRVVLSTLDGRAASVTNDVVFVMIGREPPLDFLRRSGLRIRGERGPLAWIGLGAFLLFCVWLYDWKSGGRFATLWSARHWFPFDLPERLAASGGAIASAARDPRTLLGTLAISAAGPAFWYTLAYSAIVAVFGVRRIRRRPTPYVAAQTLCLVAVQVLPLFLLPEVLLPWLDHRGALPRALADALFPVVSYGHGREFWRAYGLILAWPLDVYNVFTHRPLWWWIAIGFVQTCVLIPLAIRTYGKGVYCGWICSCGALAETLGDGQRHKMPHGPRWNRLNGAGQIVLMVAVLLLLLRITGWILPDGNWADRVFEPFKERYKWSVDVFLAGVVGYGTYFWWSGRVWCRFFCPLAALMHVYARFSRFAIVPEKKRCISCGVCTAICHQGIDVMSFANRGLPMQDPECVRCSACVHDCPTGTLQFGQVRHDGTLIRLDTLTASPVLHREKS
jgi:thioredoxin reductase/NAD-dependent dihydropyrimidine dehydrogenase PreA subunit